jgi:hypothetical protein
LRCVDTGWSVSSQVRLRCDNITSLAFNGCNLELAATQCNCFAHIVFDHGSGHDS